MKTILILLFSIFLISSNAMSQAVQDEKITISKKDLPQDVLQKYEDEKKEKKEKSVVEDVNKWVEVGKNLGAAMDAGMRSLTQQAVDFSQTPLGKFTVFIIAYKVMGKDVLRASAGMLMILIFTVLFSWSYRRTCIARKILVKKIATDKKTFFGIFKMYDREYRIEDNQMGDINMRRFAHIGFFLLSVGLSILVSFA